MKTEQVPFTVIEWEREPVTEVPGVKRKCGP